MSGPSPVVKRKRKATRVNRSSESESSSSEVDVSCSRKVEYEKREGIPGLKIYRRGPATWTPIRAEPAASRTRSKNIHKLV